jgi:hypothetical protein
MKYLRGNRPLLFLALSALAAPLVGATLAFPAVAGTAPLTDGDSAEGTSNVPMAIPPAEELLRKVPPVSGTFKLHAAVNSSLRQLLEVATGGSPAPVRVVAQSKSTADVISSNASDDIFWDGFETCGDSVIDSPSEQCDRSDLGGAACLNAGFMGGVLACDATCHFDTTQCTGQCPVACGNDNDCGICGPCFFGFCAF